MSERKSLTYVELDIPVCSRTYGALPCGARLPTDDDPVAATFDGSSTWLKRNGGLTGAADSKLWTFSVWLNLSDNLAGGVVCSAVDGVPNQRTGLTLVPGNDRFNFRGYNSSGTLIQSLSTSALPQGRWVHVMGSVDLTSTSKRHLYVDDASDLFVIDTYTNDTLDFTMTDWGVGAFPSGNSKLACDIADLWFAPGVYIDLSIEANRRKFITAARNPVALGSAGAAPTGSSPLVFLSGDIAAWHTNKGTGGGFTLTGALTEGDFATGEIKCFNTRATCQDDLRYDPEDVTLRFTRGEVAYHRESGIDAIPSLVAADISPGTIKPGESLGERSTLSVTFRDGRHPDTGPGYDKYRADRDYDPVQQGTYWGKFRARQPYLRGLKIRIINGYLGQPLEEMESRLFFVESFTGPTISGAFTIEAKDIFKQLDGDRAMAPEISNGYLVADITASSTTFTLSPSGIGNEEYESSGYLAIGGKEIVAFTRSGDVVTVTGGTAGRAQFNTTAQIHKAQDRVQTVLYIFGEDAADIISTLMTDYADVPSEYIPIDEWRTETEGFLGTVYTAVIAEPTPVRKLVDELIEQAALNVWWDDIAELVRLAVLRAILTNAALFDEDNTCRDVPLSISEQPDKRVSQVWTYYGLINPLRKVDEPDNYRSTQVTVAGEAETNNGSSAIRVVKSRWIAQFGRATAETLNNKLLARFRNAPRKFGFATQRYSDSDVELGRGYNIGSPIFQDATGARVNVPVQVTRLVPAPHRFMVECEEMRFEDLPTVAPSHRVIIDADTNNFNLRTEHDSQFIEAVAGETVTLIVNAGVTVGCSSASLRGLDIGSWPTGVIINVTIAGRTTGAGGAGGAAGANGSNGGVALYTRHPINLTYTSGAIWGGGGGGGGAGGGQCGGGGAGRVPGAGGAGVFPGSAGTETAGGAGANPSGGGTGAGAGGGPGIAGTSSVIRSGGAAGAAIDGISYVTVVGAAGDRRGSQIN